MKNTFVGIDDDLETSLKEYQCIVSVEPHEDGSGTHFIIYRANTETELYGTGHMSESEVDKFMLGKEFMDNYDISVVLDYIGCTLEDWFKGSLVQKLHDLISYWGPDNIIGTDYNPVTYKEVMKNWIEPKTEEDGNA